MFQSSWAIIKGPQNVQSEAKIIQRYAIKNASVAKSNSTRINTVLLAGLIAHWLDY
jgi:hypothetical protein